MNGKSINKKIMRLADEIVVSDRQIVVVVVVRQTVLNQSYRCVFSLFLRFVKDNKSSADVFIYFHLSLIQKIFFFVYSFAFNELSVIGERKRKNTHRKIFFPSSSTWSDKSDINNFSCFSVVCLWSASGEAIFFGVKRFKALEWVERSKIYNKRENFHCEMS